MSFFVEFLQTRLRRCVDESRHRASIAQEVWCGSPQLHDRSQTSSTIPWLLLQSRKLGALTSWSSFVCYCVVLLSFRWLFSAIITCYRAEKSLVFSLSHGFPLTITNHLRKQSKCAVSFLRLVVLGEGDVRRGAWGLARCCQPETDSRQRLAQLRNPPRSTGWVNEGRYDLIQPQPKLNMNNKALQVISESFSRSFVF